MSTLSNQDLTILRTLLCRIARAFYSPRHVLILDALTRMPMLRDREISTLLHVSHKEARSACARLRDERILRHITIKEVREEGQRPLTRNYYLVDWVRMIDGVKYRMMRIRSMLDEALTKEVAQKGYWCPRCEQGYSLEEALGRIHPMTGMFLCTYCPPELQQELQERDSSQRVIELQDKLQRWTEQTQPLMDLLRYTDAMEIPAVDEDALTLELVNEARQQRVREIGMNGDVKDEGLRFAQDSGVAGAKVLVDIQDGVSGSTKENGKGGTAALDNTLPVWMNDSTVTPGMFHQGEEQTKMRLPASNVINVRHGGAAPVEVDTKMVGSDDVDLDRYYAQLEQSDATRLGSKRASPQMEDADVKARAKKMKLEDDVSTVAIKVEYEEESSGEDEFEQVE